MLCVMPEDFGTGLSILKYGTHTEWLHGVHKLLPAMGRWEGWGGLRGPDTATETARQSMQSQLLGSMKEGVGLACGEAGRAL